MSLEICIIEGILFRQRIFHACFPIAAANMRFLLAAVFFVQAFCFEIAAKLASCRKPIMRKEW